MRHRVQLRTHHSGARGRTTDLGAGTAPGCACIADMSQREELFVLDSRVWLEEVREGSGGAPDCLILADSGREWLLAVPIREPPMGEVIPGWVNNLTRPKKAAAICRALMGRLVCLWSQDAARGFLSDGLVHFPVLSFLWYASYARDEAGQLRSKPAAG